MINKIALLLSVTLLGCGSTKFGSTAAETNKAVIAAATKAAPTLSGLAVTPAKPTVSAGLTQQFVATGTYSDGSTQDLTKTATWSVDDDTIADFKEPTQTQGLITALKVGKATVSAKSGGTTSSAALTVTAATLIAIAVTPDPITATYGTNVPLKAEGTYSDGTTADLTDQVTWASADATLATVDNTAGKNGILTPVGSGSTKITATLGSVSVTVPATITMVLTCTTPETLINSSGTGAVNASGTIQLAWSGAASNVTYSIVATSANPPANLGTVNASGTTGVAASYLAPASASSEVDVSIVATPSDASIKPASCQLRIAADGQLGVVDDGKTRGLVGNVYRGTNYDGAAGESTYVFNTMINWASNPTPVSTIVMANVNVPTRAFSLGFPGVPNLVEWFAIKLDGQIDLPTTGNYLFGTACDDGCNLYIDGVLVLSNDGVHATTALTSPSTMLTAGMHAIHIDYFQGPANQIALVLKWQPPTTAALVVIPADNLYRPATN